MKKILLTAALLIAAAGAVSAQDAGQAWKARYDRQVRAVGAAGAGVEILLDRWEAECPDDPAVHEARFLMLFTKSQKAVIVPKDQAKFMGNKPVLSLQDTTSASGKKNYFEEIEFDADLYSGAMVEIEKAVKAAPHELKYRFDKATALMSFEKETPELAWSELRSLVDYDASQKPEWTYEGKKVEKDFFASAMQEYCFSFFRIGSKTSMGYFRDLSEKMLSYNPKNTVFLDNVGSWWLLEGGDGKKALKYYQKVLKLDPDDYTAIKNTVLYAKSAKNLKLEKKYLPALIRVASDETEKMTAQARLDALQGKN